MQVNPAPLNIGDIIKMRRPDGTQGEAKFVGSLKDLLTDNGKAPITRTEVMDGVTAVRQGGLSYLEGSGLGKLSPSAHMFLLQAAEAGTAAADYLKGYMAGSNNPTFEDPLANLFTAISESTPPAESGEVGGDQATPSTGRSEVRDEFLKLVDERVRLTYNVSLGDDATYEGTEGADSVEAHDRAVLNGYKGDDLLSAYDNATINGGEGHDRINGYSGLTARGDGGDDIIDGYDGSNLDGGMGDDRLSSYTNSTLQGGAGNDHLSAYGNSRLDGGEGHDYISAYADATIDGGAGNDYINAYDRAAVVAGEGRDFVIVGTNSTVSGGDGDDILRAGAFSAVAGGQGNDTIRVGAGSTIRFDRGDGIDTIEGQSGPTANAAVLPEGKAADALTSTRIEFGAGIAADDLVVTRNGGDIRIAVAGSDDALVIRNVDVRGVPNVTFADGSSLTGSDIAARAIALPPEGIVV